MRGIDALLLAFDDAYGHAYESVTQALAGMTEPEAVWQSPAYADETEIVGQPRSGTVAWHVAHLTQCKCYYTAILNARGEAHPPPNELGQAQATWPDARAALEDAHAALRAAVTQVQDDALASLACGNMPVGTFIAMMTRHDAWHAAQIVLVRRLYRMRRA